MLVHLRALVWPLLLIVLAGWLYRAKIQHEMVDFSVYRTAAERALHGEPLYRVSDGHYQFKYLPVFALVMSPLALVDPEGGKVIWFALSAGLLTAFLRWSVRGLPERRRSERALMWLTVVFMAKFYAHELTLGQTNIVLGALLMGGLLATQVDQPRVAGLLIGLAVFIKPYALLLIPWLAFSYGTAAATSLLVIAAGLVLPTVVYGWTGNVTLLVQWFETVRSSTESNLLVSDNISLAAMWAKWIGIGRPAAALATVSTGVLLGLVAITWLRRRTVENPDYLEYALLMLIVPLLSPQGWDYVLLLGTPAVVCLLDRWSEFARPWRIVSVAALVIMGLTIFDLLGRDLYGRLMALSVVSVAALGAAASLTQARWSKLA